MSTAWMSWWEKYLAPGDIRARQKSSGNAQQDASRSQPPAKNLIQVERIDPALRQRRQNALFFGGIGFLCLSIFVTRRSLHRKRALTYPKTFTPSNAIPETAAKGDGALDALHALNLATLNVLSVFMTAVGAGAKYFDIAGVEELRDRVRSAVGFDVYAGNSNADKEIEGWIADVLARKDGTGGFREGVAEALAKIQEKEKLEQEKQGKRYSR